MNNNNPNAADAPVPPEGTEQALSETLDQASKKPKPEESSIAETLASDLISDAVDVVISILE